jgi:hypothetical protein
MIDRPAAAKNTQVRIVGDRAALPQTVFIVHWYNAVDQGLFSPAYFPVTSIESAEGDDPAPSTLTTYCAC